MQGMIDNPKEVFSLLHAASKDATRKHLGHVWLAKDGKAYGCNGHIMAWRDHGLEGSKNIPVPIETAKDIARSRARVMFTEIGNDIEIRDMDTNRNWKIEAHYIDAFTMPNFEVVKPTKTTASDKIGFDLSLLTLLHKAMNLGRKPQVKMALGGSLAPTLVVPLEEDNKATGIIMPVGIADGK